MKLNIRFLSLIVLLCFVNTLYSQNTTLDKKETKVIVVPAEENDKSKPSFNFELKKKKTPTIDLENPLTKPRTVSMIQEDNLLDAGEELEKRWKDKAIKKEYRQNQYLGDLKVKGGFVSIECRDHEYVDGDRVRIEVNGEVVSANVFLNSYYKGFNIDLKDGFNQIDFIALNQGDSGPNTAEFKVYDHNGLVVHHNEWNLTTGVKASIIVVKEN